MSLQANVVLAGPMGSGKSTVGRLVAEWLGRQFVDTDDLIARATGKPVSRVFADDGEAAFRQLEADAITAVCERRGLVVAVGGGAVVDPANAAKLRGSSHVVVLDAAPEALAARVGGPNRIGKRPLLDGAEDVVGRLAAIGQEREPAYADVAHTRIDTTDRPAEQVAAMVVAWLENRP